MTTVLLLMSLTVSDGVDIWTAPQILPPIPADVPAATAKDGGTFLPAPRDAMIADRILHYRQMPDLCQVRLDEAKKILRIQGESMLRVCRADCRARNAGDAAESESRWPTWQVVLMSGAAFVVGGSVGLVTGIVF